VFFIFAASALSAGIVKTLKILRLKNKMRVGKLLVSVMTDYEIEKMIKKFCSKTDL